MKFLMMIRNRFYLFIFSLLLYVAPTFAQAPIPIANLLEIEIVQAGFNGMFRGDEWFPVQVRIINHGIDFSGRVVVRPETTTGINNTYSVAIPELSAPISSANPTIAQTTLYAIAQERNLTLYVELINQHGATVAAAQTNLRHIAPADRLYAVISPRTLNLIGGVTANALALQADWTLSNIPTQAGAMSAIDTLILDEVNTSTLTQAQADALYDWVLSGGHLIIAGDSDLSNLPAGLSPFTPSGITTADDFSVFERFTNRGDAPVGESLITTGTATGRIIAQADDNTPYIVRHEIGYGTVDYLTFSPSLAPFNIWRGVPQLFFTLFASVQPIPPWAYGFHDWGNTRSALEIMPGLTLLPSVWSLIAFLGAYVFVVGPLNYLLLSWMNRRDYAWVTIPLSIALFSFLAYFLGFELRGDVVTINRLNVVHSWTNSDKAQINQLTGLLSPQRGDYTLSTGSNLLRPLGESLNLLNLDRQSSVEILQANQFEARNFTVDASFMMGFDSQGTVNRPEIEGAVTVTSDETGAKSLRGYIQNDLPITLQHPTIITAGIAYSLGDSLENGLTNFTITQDPNATLESAMASNQEHIFNRAIITGNTLIRSRQNAYIFSNLTDFTPDERSNDTANIQKSIQRDYLIQGLLQEQYATTGRGNRVYLIGWSNQPFLDVTINANQQQIRELNTTLYIIELEANPQPQEKRTITQDQFIWTAIERGNDGMSAPVLFDGSSAVPLVFRFIPQPNAVLAQVDQLTIILDRTTLNTWRGAVELWNWDHQTWERVESLDSPYIVIDNPAPYLGALNAVEVRTIPHNVDLNNINTGTPALNRLGVMQSGY
jgi:hypothetical protein